MKKTLITFFAIFIYTINFAQIPAGYYDGTDGLTGIDLKLALRSIITSGQQNNDYGDLYTYYQSTDNYTNGKVWDMYSIHCDGTANYWFTHFSDKCGSYSNEGDCYNREHSVPESWMGSGGSIADADLFVVVPSDGKVNGIRSNYPYGENNGESYTSTNGSKRGSCTYPGYSGTCFEPIDCYKGDFARAYFYVVTRYNVSDWTQGSSFSGDGFSSWSKAMFLVWNESDPISTKEIDRNNAVYNIQHNRNPYIDHPEWVCEVFGTNCGNQVANPANFAANGVSTSQINLSWILNENSNTVVLAYNTTNTFGTPTGNYTVGNTISGGGTVLYIGTNTSFNHTSLQSQTYYYKIWSYDATNYSTGVAVMASPYLPQPTNHVTGFAATNESSSTIDLIWNDATGTTLPLGYLIKANYYGNTIADPIDGQPVTDGLFAKNVSYGDEIVTFDNLLPNTQYVFKIYPFTNTGGNIDYKTDGTVPQASAFTTDMPTECGDESFENIPVTGSSYTNITWTGDGGGQWSATSARTDQTINGKAVCFKGYVLSPSTPNGIGNLSITTKYPFSDDPIDLIVEVNGVNVGTVPISTTQQTTTISNINISGNVDIKIISDNTNRAGIDDVIWSCYSDVPANDNNTNIIEPTEQIVADTIHNTNITYTEVFRFAVQDLGTTDVLPTKISEMTFYPSNENTSDWTNSIQNFKIHNQSQELLIDNYSITDDKIQVLLYEQFIVSNNTTEEFVLSVKLKNATVVENSVLSFMIDADNHTFVSDISGSTIAPVINFGNDIVSNPFTIISPISIQNFENSNISIFPNPNNGVFTIKNLDEISIIKIYDISGRYFYTKENTSNTEIIDLNFIEKGVYILQIENSNSTYYHKIIIQ